MNSYEDVPRSLHLAVLKIQQPTFDRQFSCSMMMPQVPAAWSRWVKIPCSYAPKDDIHVGFICKKPVNSTVTDDPDKQHVLKRAEKQCPRDWTFNKSRCYRLYTFSMMLGMNWTVASQVCPAVGSNENDRFGYGKHDMTYLLKVWRFERSHFIWLDDAIGGGANCPALLLTSSGDVERTTRNCSAETHNVLCQTAPVAVAQECGPQQFTCSDGTCITNGNVCDGMRDCVDGSDEEIPTCASALFSCKYTPGKKISISQYCDFITDCDIGSDEECTFPKCLPGQEFSCENGQCVDLEKRCNFVEDCQDGSDESLETCSWRNQCARHGGFPCYSGDCIPGSLYMDLAYDCEGRFGEDEVGESSNSSTCPDADSEPCGNGSAQCIRRSEMCIYDHDHNNITIGCRNMVHLHHCRDFECPGFYKCPNSYCIPHSKLCDGVWDCEDGVDEMSCANYTCPGLFKCKGSKICLDQHKVCDGIVDCPSGKDDERFCDLRTCPVGCTCLGYFVNCSNAGLTARPNVTTNTRAIILSKNQIRISKHIFQHFYWLALLDMSYSNLTKLLPYSLIDLHNLLQLDLSNNLITVLSVHTFYGLFRLERLNLLGNPITVIHPGAFDGLRHLGSLNLSNMYIQSIANSSFSGMPQLKSLSLASNNISFLHSLAFSHLTKLNALNIQGNTIGKVSHDVFDTMTSLKILETDAYKFCCIAPIATNCTPDPDEFSSCSDLLANQTLQVAIWILGMLAVAGNIYVIIWRCWHEKIVVSTLLIMNLAVADLLMGFYLIIIASVDTYYRGTYIFYDDAWRASSLCQLCGVLSMVSSEVSVYTILLITLDRVMVILFPLKSRYLRFGLRGASIALAAGWLMWFLFSILPLTGLDYFTHFYGRNGVCLPFTLTNERSLGWEYSTAIFIAFNFLAFIFIAAGYAAIFRYVRNSRIQSQRQENDGEIKLAARLTFVVFTDFLCWMPIIVMSIMSTSGISFPNVLSAWLAVFVLPLNSAINPIAYTLSAVQVCQKKKGEDTKKTKGVQQKSRSSLDSAL